MKIPFKKINLGNALEEIKPLIESGYIGLGNKVFEMEKKLAEYVGAKEVVAVDSCTSALFLSLKYELMQENIPHEFVSVPSMTVPLAANAVLEAGLHLQFNDDTYWVGSAYPFLNTNVWDSAHELRRDQFKVMRDSGLMFDAKDLKLCFSFYPTKTIGSADGGAIATNDSQFANWARSISTYGRNQKKKYQNSWDYDVDMIGYKRHYTNLQAVIVLEQLERLDGTNAKRQRIVKRYNDELGYTNTSDYLYRISLKNRDRFIAYMAEQGIECGVHFKPLHTMTPYRDFPVENPDKIVEEYKKTASLPLYDLLTDDEVTYIIESTHNFLTGKVS